MIITSIGITLVSLVALEKRGKLTLNPVILGILLLGFAVFSGWKVFGVITKTFLLG